MFESKLNSRIQYRILNNQETVIVRYLENGIKRDTILSPTDSKIEIGRKLDFLIENKIKSVLYSDADNTSMVELFNGCIFLKRWRL